MAHAYEPNIFLILLYIYQNTKLPMSQLDYNKKKYMMRITKKPLQANLLIFTLQEKTLVRPKLLGQTQAQVSPNPT
jgi:hypothetical protein